MEGSLYYRVLEVAVPVSASCSSGEVSASDARVCCNCCSLLTIALKSNFPLLILNGSYRMCSVYITQYYSIMLNDYGISSCKGQEATMS